MRSNDGVAAECLTTLFGVRESDSTEHSARAMIGALLVLELVYTVRGIAKAWAEAGK